MSFTVVICRANSQTTAETSCETIYVSGWEDLQTILRQWLGDADIISYHIFLRTDT